MHNIIINYLDGSHEILRCKSCNFHGPTNTATLKDGDRITMIPGVASVQFP